MSAARDKVSPLSALRLAQQQQQQPQKASSSGVRRLSSSNAFADNKMSNETLRDTYLHKLSKLAQLNSISDGLSATAASPATTPSADPETAAAAAGMATSLSPNSAFIIEPDDNKNNGYLLYLQLPKKLKGEFQYADYLPSDKRINN